MSRYLFLFFFFLASLFSIESNVSPSDVFNELKKIDLEIELLKEHFNVKEDINKYRKKDKIDINAQPKHNYQMTYMMMVKINNIRIKHDLPRIEEPMMEPMLEVSPDVVYGQTQRILAEIDIFKKVLGIDKKIEKTSKESSKSAKDVFNYLYHDLKEMDLLIGRHFSPSEAYSQVMRIYEDTSNILSFLELRDDATPPAKKENPEIKDALKAVFEMLDEISYLERKIGVAATDFSFFKKKKVVPGDMFVLICMVIGEMQSIKASLGMNHVVAPAGKYYSDKSRADVEQLMIWTIERMRLIRNSEIF